MILEYNSGIVKVSRRRLAKAAACRTNLSAERTTKYGNFSGRHRLFTLIELLVVVAIIAILASLLLPALKGARKMALVAQCTSQLRQHGVAHSVYQTDFDGYYPNFGGKIQKIKDCKYSTAPSAGRRGWLQKLHPPSIGGARNVYLREYTEAGTKSFEQQKIMRCPLIDWGDFSSWPNPLPYNLNKVSDHQNVTTGNCTHCNVGYAFYTGRMLHNECQYWRTDDGWNTKRRRRDPRELLVTDVLTYNRGWNDSNNGKFVTTSVPWFNPHVSRHALTKRKGKANQLTADGSVRAVHLKKTSKTTKFGGWRGYFHAVSQRAGPTNTSLTDGPYFRTTQF